MLLDLVKAGAALPFVTEECAYEGVKRIAEKVALDVEAVGGVKPAVVSVSTEGVSLDKTKADAVAAAKAVVFVATIDQSELIDKLSGEVTEKADAIRGKREVFTICLVEKSFAGVPGLEWVEKALVILGSDKLGTIYGLFTLSEYIGVSPMVDFGDATPIRQNEIIIKDDINCISKEPSVKYRGFFINDEWPCFGNWTFSHFGGFTAEMYDHVFEFLLRMKGNFLWPAMWSSSFPLDGPGGLNEELADLYGITISYSHHEPCLRASEEWDKVRGEDSPYGNEWNYHTNAEGLSRYWADALKRSGKYKHLITIGMRGERDSSMLGPDATLKDNIDLLKEIITKQRQLIGEHVNKDVDSVPQLLALYKEVEAYFYGDENTEGLKTWDELDNVIFMLCEDNFGHMRTLPDEEMRKHKGGFGMYYHFDYHGGPISYEWMPSSPLSLTWEQMTMAYDHGIKDVWIVNVGDLKGNEIALSYFLTLAYDFETWGTTAINSWRTYLKKWAKQTFPAAGEELSDQMAQLYEDMVHLNYRRRPEALHPGIYHPCNYCETERMLILCEDLDERNEMLYNAVSGETKQAYYSLLYHPVKSSVNLVRMHLFAGENAMYASQGRTIANLYGEKISECIALDRQLCENFASFRDGKWKGMELEQHIGFTSWNDDGWKYPVRMYVEPVTKARMSVSRADSEELYLKVYGPPRCIRINDFLSEGVDEVDLEICNDGVGSLEYTITCENGELPDWLTISSMSGKVDCLQRVSICCKRDLLSDKEVSTRLIITDGDTKVAVEIHAKKQDTENLQPMTFLPVNNVIVMEADHYANKKDVEGGTFKVLEGYGRDRNAMKAFPSTKSFVPTEDKPELTYRFMAPVDGEYVVEIQTTPTNALQNKRPLRIQLSVGELKDRIVEILDASYRGGENSDWNWCRGVLEQIRRTQVQTTLKTGYNEIKISPLESGMVLEKIMIYPVGQEPKKSYLGPQETYFKKA